MNDSEAWMHNQLRDIVCGAIGKGAKEAHIKLCVDDLADHPPSTWHSCLLHYNRVYGYTKAPIQKGQIGLFPLLGC